MLSCGVGTPGSHLEFARDIRTILGRFSADLVAVGLPEIPSFLDIGFVPALSNSQLALAFPQQIADRWFFRDVSSYHCVGTLLPRRLFI